MSQPRSRSVFAGVAAVIAVGIVAGAFVLTGQHGTDDPALGGAGVGIGPSASSTSGSGSGSGSSGTGSGSGSGGSGSGGTGMVTITRTGPDLPGSAVLDRCATSSRNTVARYDTAALGTVVLQCGTSSQGYEHIRVRHTGDWAAVVRGHGSRDWDDAMLTAVQTALEQPAAGYPQDAGAGKVCYAAPVRFDDGARPGAEPFVRVIVSSTTDRVITAFPTRDGGC